MDENGTIEIENVTLDKTDHIDKNGDNYCDNCEQSSATVLLQKSELSSKGLLIYSKIYSHKSHRC